MSLKSPFALLSESITFYRAHFSKLLGIVLIPVLAMFIVAILGGGSFVLFGMGATVAVGIAGVVAVIVLSILSSIAAIIYVGDPAGVGGVKNAYTAARPLFFPYALTSLLFGVLAILGFLLFIIPGIIVCIWFIFSQFTVIFEGKRGMTALKASREYVKGRFGAVIYRVFALFVIYILFAIILNVVLSFIINDKETVKAVGDILGMLVGPIGIVYLYLLYRDVRAAAEAGVAPTTPVTTTPPTV